jgi:hypothetical protein
MKRKRRRRVSVLLVALLVGALVGAGWYLLHGRPNSASLGPAATTPKSAPGEPIAVAIDHVESGNEGRNVVISGALRVTAPARDTELGIGADALALLRQVEMRQWRETCAAAICEYALIWATKPIDWHPFRDRAGHENSMPFPFSSQRFLAAAVRLGAFNVDPALASAAIAPVAYPVHVAQLPPNLAATFRDQDGVLYTGAAASPPAPGDLRISYRIVPAGEQRLSGVQKGDRLTAPALH